ncbi:hypothetical protein BDZ94DRAFT_1274990 [Collybia nuda]|uniref:Uncharacterized protein n=1 Tax=Collybia nuda TaxID=64659 RepID=A0A9P6C8X1_9AGAR|nr:hypothetical protein BDZ94DRAFT_1274990 [Collybia nuda]
MSQVPAKVDDRDPRVEYLPDPGLWMLGGVQEEFDSTTHGTAMTGSQVRFTFQGPYVNVFGTISNVPPYPGAPISTYSLDGSSPQEFHPAPPNGISYRQAFYRSPWLEYKQHVLIITFTASSNASFWLDYFEIIPNEASTSPSSSLPPSVTSPPSPLPPQNIASPFESAHIVPTISKPLPTLSSSPSDSNDSLQPPPNTPTSSDFVPGSITQLPSSSTPTDPSNTNSASASALPSKNPISISSIVGGVLGGVILILLVCFSILYYRRKKGPQRSLSDVGVRHVSIGPARNSFETNQPPPSINLNSENSRFIGSFMSFTDNLGNADGRISDRFTPVGETVAPRDTLVFPDSVTSPGKAEMQMERGDELYNMGPPPPYS